MLLIDRTVIKSAVVSTVMTVGGSRPRYETALIVGGRVSDPRVTHSIANARMEHDMAVAFLRGELESGSLRADFWATATKDVA
jgi:hypothetical protein